MTQYKHFNQAFLLLHFIFSLSLGGYYLMQSQWYFSLLAFSSFFLLLLPSLSFKLLKRDPAPQCLTLAYIFCTLSFTVGMALQAYHCIPLYDKLLHTLSGLFFSFLSLICYALLKAEKKTELREFPVAAAFSFNFSMMVAAVWELYEYFLSLVSTMDPQNVLTTGIHDTMQDILVCLIGSLLFLIPEYLYFRKGKKDLFMAAYEAFVQSHKQKA